jgi:hypothetical protein
MTADPLATALGLQARACDHFGSPFYAALLCLAVDDLGADVRALFAPWDGREAQDLLVDAVALRFLGALHDLVLEGAADDLAAAFPPTSDAGAAWRAVKRVARDDRPRLAAFMAHEPQTNEVLRSACLLPGFLTVAAASGLPLRCLELGASAGLNQLWSQFFYRLGDAGVWGDPASPVRLETQWRGPPPPLAAPVAIAEVAGCDRKPVDLNDAAQRRRLAAYIWPDQAERLARLKAAIAMALAARVEVERADAAAWARERAAPEAGVATVVYQSIFAQYLSAEEAVALRAAIEAHATRASAAAPLAWLRMEPAQSLADIELRLTLWPGGEDRRLASVHPHGAWVEWGS